MGKMTIGYLRPKHKPSTRHVGRHRLHQKKSVGSKGHTFFYRWKHRGIGHNVSLGGFPRSRLTSVIEGGGGGRGRTSPAN